MMVVLRLKPNFGISQFFQILLRTLRDIFNGSSFAPLCQSYKIKKYSKIAEK